MAKQTARQKRPFIVALTGGIASGKTLVSDAFARLGVPVIDTDVIAREVVAPGQPALQDIVEAFGADMLDEAGQLRRTALRQLIFEDADARHVLESILHPCIRRKCAAAIDALDATYCILVIPLLAEKRGYDFIDRVLVVDTTRELQVERLMARDGCSREHAEQVLAAQAQREHRLQIADDVLDNSAAPQTTRQAVARLDEKYRALAESPAGGQ